MMPERSTLTRKALVRKLSFDLLSKVGGIHVIPDGNFTRVAARVVTILETYGIEMVAGNSKRLARRRELYRLRKGSKRC